MSGQHQPGGKAAPSQPLTDWLAWQYDTPAARMVGPWSGSWDGHALASQARPPSNNPAER